MAVLRLFAKSTTVGGASVVSTSGFRFLVGHNLNRWMCGGEFLEVAYFLCERCSNVI